MFFYYAYGQQINGQQLLTSTYHAESSWIVFVFNFNTLPIKSIIYEYIIYTD